MCRGLEQDPLRYSTRRVALKVKLLIETHVPFAHCGEVLSCGISVICSSSSSSSPACPGVCLAAVPPRFASRGGGGGSGGCCWAHVSRDSVARCRWVIAKQCSDIVLCFRLAITVLLTSDCWSKIVDRYLVKLVTIYLKIKQLLGYLVIEIRIQVTLTPFEHWICRAAYGNFICLRSYFIMWRHS